MPGPIRSAPPPVPGTHGTTGAREAPRPKPSGEVQVAPPHDGFVEAGSTEGPDLGGGDAIRDPAALTSDLRTAGTPQAVVKRLGRELPLVLPQLIDLSTLTRDQKASRLVQFFAPYAARFAELAQPMEPSARAALEQQLLAPMLEAGLAHVTDLSSGHSGLWLAQQLLAASPADRAALLESMRPDAPAPGQRGEKEPTSMLPIATRLPEPPLLTQPRVALEPSKPQSSPSTEQGRPRRGGVLGKSMLWNTLHLFRKGADAPTLEQEEQLRTVFVVLAIGVLAAVLIAAAIVMA